MNVKRISIFLVLTSCLISGVGRAATFQVKNADAKPWSAILGTIGIAQDSHREPDVVVAGQDSQLDIAALAQNKIVILEGAGASASKVGILSKAESVRIRQISDTHAPGLPIIWEQPVEVPQVALPDGFQIFAAEKWKNVPVLAGKRTAHGAILWLITTPGTSGIERFPYLLQALTDLGYTPAAQTTTLWAFFDSSYRIRADPDYLAQRLAAHRYRRPSYRGLAQHGTRSHSGWLSQAGHRGVSPPRHRGVCMARASARKRKILGRPSGMAREDRRGSGCTTRLAQVDELAESRLP